MMQELVERVKDVAKDAVNDAHRDTGKNRLVRPGDLSGGCAAGYEVPEAGQNHN